MSISSTRWGIPKQINEVRNNTVDFAFCDKLENQHYTGGKPFAGAEKHIPTQIVSPEQMGQRRLLSNPSRILR
jgi:hypothetical protein